MKDICIEYKKHIKELLNNRIYIICIILVAILSYGFTITNFSIGIDDLCADRYVTGNYILSAGRWGTTALYYIFQLFEFTPFWLEMIVTILTVFMGIIFTAFIKKNIGGKLSNIHYIITTSILISYPILHQSFIYQSTNLSVIISNLALMIVPILIYEVSTRPIETKKYLILSLVMSFFISMYESCCQTYILMVFIICFLQIFNQNENNKILNKRLFRYLKTSILILVMSILLNIIIGVTIKAILNNFGLLEKDYSTKNIPWINFKNINIIDMINNNVINKLYTDLKNVDYIRNFMLISYTALIITIYKSIKEKKYIQIPLMLGIIASNFVINILQIGVLYRTNTSWCISIAFFTVFILINANNKIIKYSLCTVFIIITLLQTKTMNQAFYNDYVRYQKEANYAHSIANQVISKCEDTTKPIVYLYKVHKGTHQNQINKDNGWSIINWGSWAFEQPGSETTKFINSLGYNFTIATNEQTEKMIEDFNNSKLQIIDNEKIYEEQEYILVIMDVNI